MGKDLLSAIAIPELTGKVVIVTGGHTGLYVDSVGSNNQHLLLFDFPLVLVIERIGSSSLVPLLTLSSTSGFGTSIELARHGARVYIASRSHTRFEHARRDIIAECSEREVDVRFLNLDLSSISSVRHAAEQFIRCVSCFSIIDVFFNPPYSSIAQSFLVLMTDPPDLLM